MPASLVSEMVRIHLQCRRPGSGRSPWEGNSKGTHSSILAWRIPWMEESGGLQPMWSQRVRHDWVTHTHNISLYICIPHLLYPFTCQWTFRLFPCLGCCEYCCCEHRGASIFLNYSFVWVYTQEWDHWIMWQFYF